MEADAGMTEYRVDAVSRVFGAGAETVEALRDIHLAIGHGEFVSLVGPSGCGKSTLMRLLSGLDLPTAGTIELKGRRIDRPQSGIGMVFQSPTLLPWRTVLDNVLLPAELMGRPRAEFIDGARELIRTVGLEGFENRLPHELSGGMQQRVGICRALIHQPAVLLMDEPFAALDMLTRDEMALELGRICDLRPVTVVFVTHSISEAVLLSDRVVVMSPRPGRIREIIDIDLPRPRNEATELGDAFRTYVHRIKAHIYGRASAQAA
jgi:NitT/TauT family transport system ATP-binding protein